MRFLSASVCSFTRSTSPPKRMSVRSKSDGGSRICFTCPRTASDVVRLSSVQSSTNCTNDCRSSSAAGIPRTTRGEAVGVSRIVLVWQTAQLRPT